MSEFNNPSRVEFDSDHRRYARAEMESGVVLEFSGQEYVLVAKDVSAGGLSTSPHREIIEASE
ncbi:MAG: hypothetical protein ACRD3T_21320, partial [Terriglobia bacterium]